MTQAEELLKGWQPTRVLADKGYDSNAVLANVAALNAEAVIPPKANRLIQRVYDKEFYKERHLVECFFNKLEQFRCVFSRFDRQARNYLSFVQFASMMIWLR